LREPPKKHEGSYSSKASYSWGGKKNEGVTASVSHHGKFVQKGGTTRTERGGQQKEDAPAALTPQRIRMKRKKTPLTGAATQATVGGRAPESGKSKGIAKGKLSWGKGGRRSERK